MHRGKNKVENDYLWDGSGTPDPELQKLEKVLGKFRHDAPTPAFPAIVSQARWTMRLRKMRLFPALSVAAAMLVIAAGMFVFRLVHRRGPTQVAVGWNVSPLAGAPRVGRRVITADRGSARLGVGQLLETDNQSRASLQSDEIGQVEVEPSSRVRLLAMGSLKRIALDRGTIHAFIWAPPGQFVVDTPSATTVDLGCAYTLQVDDSGAGLLRTSLGWVGFTSNGHESFIPAGAACATRPRVGPGTPYFEDASAEFQAALARFDFEDTTGQQHANDLATILAESRVHDALTLWHLLSRVDVDQRVRVYERLRELAPPPANVTREGILRLDQVMLDQWWNSLGFDDISIWRHWEHAWTGAAARGKQ
jgi:hypothetical protein